MAQKSSGSQHGARSKLSRAPRQRTTVNDYMKEFDEGEKVLIKYNPSEPEGRGHMRFHGHTAEVKGFRGEAVELEIRDGNKTKTLFLKPVHLQKVGE